MRHFSIAAAAAALMAVFTQIAPAADLAIKAPAYRAALPVSTWTVAMWASKVVAPGVTASGLL